MMKAMMMVPWLDGAGEEEFFLPKTRELVECRMAHAGEEEGCVQRRKKMDDGLLSSQSRSTLTIK